MDVICSTGIGFGIKCTHFMIPEIVDFWTMASGAPRMDGGICSIQSGDGNPQPVTCQGNLI